MESREARVNKALGVEPQWVVADRVIAAWDDEERNVHFLGRLSSHNRKAEFSLMLGHFSEDTDAFLLLLHLPLRVRAGSASKPIDLFIVLPVENLNSPSSLNISPITSSELPEPHQDAIRSASLTASSNVFRVQLRVREPGYVLMPRMKIKNELVGTPRDLVLSLKSLSKASSFDVYLKRNTYSQVALNGLASAVLEGTAHTPAFRLKSMYQGRGAKQNAWELFGLDAADTTLKAGNPLALKPCEEDREGSAPPPYEEVVRTPTPSPEKLAEEPSSDHQEKGDLETPRTPDVVVRDSQSLVEETPPKQLLYANRTCRKRAYADAESPTTSDKDAETETKRASRSLVQLPLFANSSTPIPGSPPLIHRPHSSPPTSHASFAAQSGVRSVPDLEAPRHNLSTDMLLCEVATWLQDGWAVDSNVHRKLMIPLLALGYHARRRDLVDFDLAKGRCTSLLYIRIATQAGAGSFVTRQQAFSCADFDVEEDMTQLIAWANGSIFRGVESVLREETALLGTFAARVCDNGLAAREAYIRQRALWVASVFVCFGTSRDVETLTERRFNIVEY